MFSFRDLLEFLLCLISCMGVYVLREIINIVPGLVDTVFVPSYFFSKSLHRAFRYPYPFAFIALNEQASLVCYVLRPVAFLAHSARLKIVEYCSAYANVDFFDVVSAFRP